jgi:hypothetical protein
MRRLHAILLAGLMGLTFGTAALADGWGQFYVSSQRAAGSSSTSQIARGGEGGVCIREILAAQARHGIPDNMLLAIGLQEAGTRRNGQFTVWPYAVNAEGEGRLFDSRAAALDWITERQRAGVRSIDVGCMQINMRWHPDAFVNAAQGFDPTVNVDYAARFLKQLYGQTGNWMQAAGSYHSQEPQFRDIYLARLRNNIAAANARLPEFTAIAGGSGPRRAAPPVPRDTSGNVVVARATWGASLGGASNARTSLYSTQSIQPILPTYTSSLFGPAG